MWRRVLVLVVVALLAAGQSTLATAQSEGDSGDAHEQLPDDPPGAVWEVPPGDAGSAEAGPREVGQGNFQMPFPCGEVWGASTYSGHNAIDWNLIGADDTGRRVEAGLAGTVTTASGNGQWNGGYGNYVIVAHGDGWASLFAHLSAVNVSVGQAVFPHSMIGAVGTTGNSTGSHLHWEQRLNGSPRSTLYENGGAINPGLSPPGNAYTSHNCDAPPPHDLVDGDLYRIGSAPEVYVVIGGARFQITNPDELQRRLNNGEGPIYSVTQGAHDALGTVPRDGTLFRNEDSLQQYFVVSPAAMPVNSGDVAALQSEGVDTDNVQVAPPGLSTVLGSVPRAGVAIRGAGAPDVWLIDPAGHRRYVETATILQCHMGDRPALLAPPGAALALTEGPAADCRNQLLENKDTGDVYYLDQDERRSYVQTPVIRDCIRGRAGAGGPVRVSATVIDSFPSTSRNAYCPYPVGIMVRGDGQDPVWLIKADGRRQHVATQRGIACHGGYGNLSIVPAGEVDAHILTGTASDNCDLTDHQLLDHDTGAVSYIDSDGRRWPVSSPVIRNCIAVRAGTGQPISVHQSVIAEFQQVPDRLAYCPYPVGSLVRGAGQDEVWQIRPNGKRVYVPDDETVACLGGSVAEVPTGEVDGHKYIGVATCPRPDARIRNSGSTSYRGDGIYNTTGSGQTITASAARGRSLTFTASAQNDAAFPDRLRLRGTASNGSFAVSYRANGAGVTNSVTAGTYLTPILAPGETFTVTITVTVRTSAPTGSALTGGLTASSNTDPTTKDKVVFVARRA